MRGRRVSFRLRDDGRVVLLQHSGLRSSVFRVQLPAGMLPLLHANGRQMRRLGLSVLTRPPRTHLLLGVSVVGLAVAIPGMIYGADLIRLFGLASLALVIGACTAASP